MKENNEIHPPRWAERLLAFYCRPELLEDLEGDLYEYLQRNAKEKGARKARLIYIIDVFKFLRPYTIRKPKFLNTLIQWVMIGSYIKTSGRSIVRNKLFSAINIFGLAISMSVGLMMIGILSDTFSYDKFNENHKRIYRVVSRYQFLERKDRQFVATSSLKAARIIKETFSIPEDVVVFRREFSGDVKAAERAVPINGMWASASVFKVFSFEMLKGNASTALKEPFSMVLTETAAKKLFGSDEAMGKNVVLNNDRSYTVTGVMKDVPVFSHIRFEMLGSLSTREILLKDNKREMAWDNCWNAWTYLLLPPDADLKSLQASLDQLSAKEDPSVENTHIELKLQPLGTIVAGENMGNPAGPTMGEQGLWIFGALTFVVLLSACFNYTNLSIARSLRRNKEVGIRKVIGALKGHVVGQFIVESIIISVSALSMAIILFYFLRPYFLGLEKELQSMLRLELSPAMIGYFILFAIGIGIIAGAAPAIFFSRVSAIKVLKDVPGTQGLKKLTMRKALVVFQYALSIVFITSTVIFFKQYKHLVAFDLGYNTENVLNISLQGNKADILKKELEELPEVKGISKSAIVTSVGSYYGSRMKYLPNPHDSAGVYYNMVDENYFPLHEHHLLAGRNFNPQNDSLAESEVIVNEQVLKRFNIANQDPIKALDELVVMDGKTLRIIGVMKNFHYGKVSNLSLDDEVVFRYSSKNPDLINVKIESADLISTYAKIESVWKKIDNVHPFKAKFYADQIDDAFSGFRAVVKLAGFLAFLAICIASMGLLGMVVFTTETRLKEISIRKVLGASESMLVYLMGKGFFVLLLIATAVGLPITYIFFDQVMFREIGNYLPISAMDLSIGVLGIMIIAGIMVVSQTLKVARTNPATVLKNE
jgi:putative ABC transport system permease protein